MNVTGYIPKSLEAKLHSRARRARVTPSLYSQSVIRQALDEEPARFSESFIALAGSWEDNRDAEQVIADIRGHRDDPSRARQRPG
jgi:hypothetical protein